MYQATKSKNIFWKVICVALCVSLSMFTTLSASGNQTEEYTAPVDVETVEEPALPEDDEPEVDVAEEPSGEESFLSKNELEETGSLVFDADTVFDSSEQVDADVSETQTVDKKPAGNEISPAALYDENEYDPVDVEVINGIIDNNGLQWTRNDPASWPTTGSTSAVRWTSTTPKKITRIYYNTNFTTLPKLTGKLDVSGLVNLTYLNCINNELTELDVSKNENLTELICNSNRLTELDVSKNVNLTGLQFTSNRLTELDVRNNVKLTYLYCGANQLLTELDVSKNVNLTYLHCYNNSITELDVRAQEGLTSLECFGNKLTELDVSKNVNLTYLRCYLNQLTGLDVSKNVNLTYLQCYSNPMEYLNIANTAMTIDNNCQIFYGSNRPMPLKTFVNQQSETLSISSTDGGNVWFTGYTLSTGQFTFLAEQDTLPFTTWKFTDSPVNLVSGSTSTPEITFTMPGGDSSIRAIFGPTEHPVTVSYVDRTGSEISAISPPPPANVEDGLSYTVTPQSISGYLPQYYTVNDGSTRYDLSTPVTITSATHIKIYYASTDISVDFPTESSFHVDETTYFDSPNNVKNGTIDAPQDYFTFENTSELPLEATFKKLDVIDDAGLTFVPDATTSPLSSLSIHLNLEPPTVSGNAFSVGVRNIDPAPGATYNTTLGILDGTFITSPSPASTKGHLAWSGYYAGPFFLDTVSPKLQASFDFSLKTS